MRRALRRQDAATALRMGRALNSYWYIGGSHSEGRGWMEQIVALPNVRPEERAAAWTIGAIQAFLQGDYEPIETGLDDALHVFSEAQDGRIFCSRPDAAGDRQGRCRVGGGRLAYRGPRGVSTA
jgi:hypothetical protein